MSRSEEFAAILRGAMIAANVSQKQLAVALNTHPSEVSRLLNGKPIDHEAALKIGVALGRYLERRDTRN